MRDYAVDDYGLVLDEETMKIIASKVFDDFIDNNEEYGDWGYEIYDRGKCEYISDFTGEAQELTDDGVYTWGGNSKDYRYDSICYVPTSKYPTLFKRAYNNMEEIVEEFKSKLGKYLPKDFDYRNKIRHISGTYYG
jgi:uncharacterized protein (UPF0297 family)